MTTAEITQIIIAASSLVSAVSVPVVAIVTVLNRKAIREVHLSLNSRLDQLVESKSAAARMEGHAAGVTEGKQET